MEGSVIKSWSPYACGVAKRRIQTQSQYTNLVLPTLSSLKPHSTSYSASKIAIGRRFQPQPLPSLFGSTSAKVLCGISSNGCGANGSRSVRDWIEVVGEAVSMAFPLWVTAGCVLGLLKPNCFDWVTPKLSIAGLTIVMLGMGMTLTLDDLRGALSMPKEVLSGFLLQYSVMPLSGYLVSKILNLPSHFAVGLILVGCCPGGMNFNHMVMLFTLFLHILCSLDLLGLLITSLCFVIGTASNVVTYLARGNVALSVIMTAASTLSAVIMTPFLTAKLAGKYVAVDAAAVSISTLQVVLLPVLAGAFLNQFCQPFVKFVSPLMPPLAVTTVAIIGGSAIAQNSSAILMSGVQVILASSLLHASGFIFGYILARMLGLDISSSRTISIEVGMQNSALGLILAGKHFGDPLTAVPCAVSSVCHSIFGSMLAAIWRQSLPTEVKD